MTKSSDAWVNYQAESRRLLEEYAKAVQEEFLPGMRVRWAHTYDRDNQPVYREGIVVAPVAQAWGLGTKVHIQMKQGGPIHQIDGAGLHILDAAQAAAKGEHGNG